MTEEERRRQSGTVEYVPGYGEFAAAQNAGNAASNFAAGIMPVTYAQGGAYTPAPAATPAAATYSAGAAGGTMPTTPTTTPTTPGTTPGTTPETTPTTTPTTTYGENVDGLTVRQMIEEQRKASYAEAEKERERSVIDASTAYAQNKATYGANAEALAGMGLTGGGYGDYLNSRAYAQQREEIQAARAGEAAAKREADRVYYADMMVQKEKEDAEKKAEADKSNAAFIDLLAKAKTGNYTAEDIKNMAAKAGITNQADIDALTSAATTAHSNVETDKSNKINAAYAEGLAMAESGDYSAAAIEAWAKGQGITDQTMIDALKRAANVAAQKKTIGDLVTPETTDEEIAKMIADGKLFPENEAAAKAARDGEKGEATDKANKQNAAYAEGLAMIESGNGNISAATIEAWAKGKGITDQTTIDALKRAANVAAQKKTIGDLVTPETTDEEIAKMIADGKLFPENEAAAKAARDGEKGEATDKANKQNAAYAEGLAKAESGDYSAATIEAWAKGQGITDQTMIDALKKAANVAAQRKNIGDLVTPETTDEEIAKMIADGKLFPENEAAAKAARDGEKGEATDKQNTNYVNLLDMAIGGDFTEEVIRDLAKRMGLSDEDVEKLVGAAKTAREEKERKNISDYVSADTTDEEISNMIISGELSESNRAEAEKARTDAAEDEISAMVDAGNYEGADTLVEKYYQSGAIGDDERQNYYMEKLTSGIEAAAKNGDISAETVKAHEQALEKAKNEGKISQADYDAAKKYLYGHVTTVLDGANVKYTPTRSTKGEWDKTSFNLTINGETIKAVSHGNAKVDKAIQNVLDSAAGTNPTEGTIVLYDDGIYVYVNSRGSSGWYKASRNVFNEGVVSSLANKRVYDIMKNDIKPKTATPTRPEHKAAK